IKAEAFSGVRSINTVVLGNNIEIIEKLAFKGCAGLKKFVFNKGLKRIEQQAFRGCDSLKTVKIPKSITYIGDKCFMGCTSLKTATIGATQMEKASYALLSAADKSITEAALSEKYADINITIGVSVFSGCSALKKVIINCQVTVIGNSAFVKCVSLSSIVVYSKQLKTVGKSALKGVHNCKISVPKVKLKNYKSLFKNKGQGKKVVVAKL
ncbi:MAG TPA: hypothetical protein DCP06_02980, partial [Lachnospiraceae bacterium]|nr:hypothetical protein [Lachnospiraceae bacterium]